MALGKSPLQLVESGDYPLLDKAPYWERISLSDIATVQNGYAFSSKYFNRDEGMPLIRIRDVRRDWTENLYSGEFEKAYVVRKGDLLIGMDGDFSAAIWKGRDGLLNQRVCRLVQHTNLYAPAFLFLVLQPYLNAIHAETSSVTVKHLSSRTISEIPLPLPPLNEQKRIVEKIEELFSEIDAGVASLQRAREQLGVYRQALLKKAFTGELTAKWRAENPDQIEPAEQLLERIRQEREARYQQQVDDWKAAVQEWEAGGKEGKKPAKPRKTQVIQLSDEELEGFTTLPRTWIWSSLSDLSMHIVDGTHKTPKYVDSGVYFVSAKDIFNFKVSLQNTRFITQLEHKELVKRCRPEKGNILITKSGTLGRVAVVKNDTEFSLFESVANVPLINFSDPNFHAYQIYSTIKGSFGALNQKGVAVRHLHLEDLRCLPIALAPAPEQKEIVRLLEAQFEAIEQNEREIAAALTRAEALRQSILKKAFSGQLVPQDTNDEPARILLERIRREKAEAGRVKKVSKKATKKRARKKAK